MSAKSSRLHSLKKLEPEERLKIIKEIAGLNDMECDVLRKSAISLELADIMVENVIGTTEIPFGIATNFKINKKEVLVPMAIEEPSVIAAASHAAKLALPEGFTAESEASLMIGQIQLVNIKDVEEAKNTILANKEEITKRANSRDSMLIKFGGGVKDVEARIIESERGKMLIVHIIVDVKDAMGANAINTMVEYLAPFLEELTGGRSRLRIISNLAEKRLVRARAVWKKKDLGEDVIEGMLDIYHLAKNDPFRAATHNKGIMNGIDAVAIATGNDWRALEAGAHAYASYKAGSSSKYQPLTKYEKDGKGNLVGSIEIPLAVGIVGGATKTHPVARIGLKILGVSSAGELAEIMACVGLANNFAAVRAISKEGIQRGHMELHANNIAVIAGAKGDLVEKIAEQMIKEKNITVARAKDILEGN